MPAPVDDGQSGVIKPRQNLARTVRGAVIQDHHSDVFVVLREDRLDQDTDVTLFVAGGHHDTDADRFLWSERVLIGPVLSSRLAWIARTSAPTQNSASVPRQTEQTRSPYLSRIQDHVPLLSSMASIGSLSRPSGAPSPTLWARNRA